MFFARKLLVHVGHDLPGMRQMPCGAVPVSICKSGLQLAGGLRFRLDDRETPLQKQMGQVSSLTRTAHKPSSDSRARGSLRTEPSATSGALGSDAAAGRWDSADVQQRAELAEGTGLQRGKL